MQFALPLSPTLGYYCRTHQANTNCRSAPRPQQQPRFADTRRCGCKARVQRCAAVGAGTDTKALKETAALDQLIDLLMEAKSQQQLAKLVTDNVLSLDQKFWLRLATRSDTAASQQDKDKVASLANTVMTMAAALVKQTEGQLNQSTSKLQTILTAAADDKGEWHLPLTQQQSTAMRQALDQQLGESDEAILSTAFSWMRKAADDKQDGMISLIQKMLQLYAAQALHQLGDSPSPVDQVIQADEEQWEPLIRQLLESDQTTESDFSLELQKKMEGTVLGQSSGSYKQRVQAEYLKEIEARFKGVHQSILDQKAV